MLSSDRERRLWFWLLAVVVAIYSTLGLARTLADELRNRGLLDTTFVWCTILLVAATVALAFRIRPRGAEIGVALAVFAVYVLAFVRMALPEERTHLVEYGVVTLLVYEALTERAANGRHVPRPALTAVVIAVAVGTLDELIQALIPSRVFDPVDIFVNVVAVLLAITARLALGRAGRARLDA